MILNTAKTATLLLTGSLLTACVAPTMDTKSAKISAQKPVTKPTVVAKKPMRPQAKPRPKPKPKQQVKPRPRPTTQAKSKPQVQAKPLPANATRLQQLQGYDWKLTQFKDEKGATKRAFDMGGPVQHYIMKIAAGNRVAIEGKCNILTGVGKITEQGVFAVPKLAGSRKGCPSKFRQADAQMSGLVRYAKNYRLQGKQLQVMSEGGTMFFQGMPAGQ